MRAAVRVLLLASFACVFVFAASANAAGGWRQLHRSLDLPTLSAGEPCPVSVVDQRVNWDAANIFGGSGIGPGPAYPALGGEPIGLFEASQPGGPWFRGKLFWYVTPAYRDRVLIRGRRLDGPGSLGFLLRGEVRSELRIGRENSVSWAGQPPGSRGVPSSTLAQTSGCYGVQSDGTRFSRVAVFSVTVPRWRSGAPGITMGL